MKRFVISIFAFVLVISVAITNYFVVKNSTEKITDTVNEMIRDVDNKGDIERCREKIEKLWQQERRKLSFLVEHAKFEILDESLIRLKCATDSNEFKKECEHIKWFVNEIKSSEELSFENIF